MNAPHHSADTPVMRQYLEIKRQYPDAIVMFRMGDFYEMFFDDAVTVGPVLDIAVTTRDKGDIPNPVPMAGVPYHAVGGYLRTLVERGFKVAICEQMETPEQARQRKGPNKIVRREVVRVVTPGVLIDEEHLRGEEPNYLAALVHEAAGVYGLALLDVSCGEFFVVLCEGAGAVRAALSRLAPREIVCEPGLHPWLNLELGPGCPRLEGRDPAAVAEAHLARVRRLREESGGDPLVAVEERAAALALAYAEDTQPGQTLLLHRLRREAFEAHLVLDDASLRNLEVFRTLRDGQRKGSLLWAVDCTRTAMGARLLRSWLGAPLRELGAIRERHDAIDALLAEPRIRGELQERLRDVRDIARLAARARLGTVNPRELAALRQSLAALPGLAGLLLELARRRAPIGSEGQGPEDMSQGACSSDQALCGRLPALLDLGGDLLQDVHAALARLLVDDPPAHTREGGVIRPGADPELDRQLALRDGGREALAAIEARERERTGIPNLRVQHNRVFGYYIEVLKT
ncbi:MAG TPA: hypothetical protein VIK91_11355, partial [Nannocystis sp.]